MITASRIEMEMRIRQQQLLKEMEREQQAEGARLKVVRVSGEPRVHSQFFARRFGFVMSRLKVQLA
ncbi:MAG TPA: hypothetical protein VFP05_08125 [Thermomicrobiales bacterium]|nr:hypothetical protein [Thermomicrobiales bacterium]